MRVVQFCLLLIALVAPSVTQAQDLTAIRPAPAPGMIGADDGTPWIGQAGISPPLDVKPADTGATLRTSSTQWRDFDNQLLARRIDEAKAANKALTPPKAPAVLPSPFELWTSVDLVGLAQHTDSAVKTSAGANYKLSKSATFGVEATRADTRAVTATTSTQDDKFAGFVSYQATSMISFDARTQWETATTGTAKTDTNAVSIAPKIKVPMKLASGQTLEPFVTVKDELSLTTTGPSEQTKHAISAGTGVTFANPGHYTMSLTAGTENLTAPDPTTYTSRFQLSVPLR